MQYRDESKACDMAKHLCLQSKVDYYVSKGGGMFHVTTQTGKGNVVKEFKYQELAKEADVKLPESNKKGTGKSTQANSAVDKPDLRKGSQVAGNDKG